MYTIAVRVDVFCMSHKFLLWDTMCSVIVTKSVEKETVKTSPVSEDQVDRIWLKKKIRRTEME